MTCPFNIIIIVYCITLEFYVYHYIVIMYIILLRPNSKHVTEYYIIYFFLNLIIYVRVSLNHMSEVWLDDIYALKKKQKNNNLIDFD